MMMSEFVERTGYQPSNEEYAHIEESYYTFPGNKDEFCAQWKKDYKDGHWERELTLRRRMAAMQAECTARIEGQKETIKFYQAQADESIKVRKALEQAQDKLARLERCFARVFGNER